MDLYYEDPAQPPTTAGDGSDYLDHDLSDLSCLLGDLEHDLSDLVEAWKKNVAIRALGGDDLVIYVSSALVLVRLSMVDISTRVGIVPVPERSAVETSRRELSEDVSFGIGILFGCRAINRAGKPTRGGVAYSQEDR